MRWLLAALFLCCTPLVQASAGGAFPRPLVDKVLVLKSERTLHLISRGESIRSYRVALGKRPTGHKLREGDKRTPEGLYWIDWRRTSEKFHLSMHISYPNIRDLARARREGVEPGGMIMLHGTPDYDGYPEWFFDGLDWTDGCIALSNADMREVWDLVPDDTLIEIRP